MKTAVLMTVLFTAVAAAAAPLGTEFTYQGVLSDGSVPAAGSFDFRFIVYDAEVGGSQVGTTVLVDDLAIIDGRVTTPIDFGAVFDGAALWLEVSVRDGASTGSYTVLSPRQELTAAPFSHYATMAGMATTAGHAATAGNADTLNGNSGAHYLAWSNLTGKPGGLDDGDDDTLSDLSCAPDEVAAWNGSAWNCASDRGVVYSRTAVVGPVGDSAANGAALFSAVSALPTPASAAEGWLVEIEPGEYDLGGLELYLEDWVGVRGAGSRTTVIRSEVCGSSGGVISLGIGDLTDVFVENTCGDGLSEVSAIRVRSASHGARIRNTEVRLQADAGAQIGIDNSADSVWIWDTIVTLDGSSDATGIRNDGIDIFLIDVLASATGTGETLGVSMLPDSSGVIVGGSFRGIAGSSMFGLYLDNATVDVRDAGFEGLVYIVVTSGDRYSTFTGIDAHDGIALWGNIVGATNKITVRRSRISGQSAAVFTVGEFVSVRLIMTELTQGGTTGRVYCTAVVDEAHAFYPNTCP